MRHGQYENTPRITGGGAAQPGFEKILEIFQKLPERFPREFP
jgi:hypothetical protein